MGLRYHVNKCDMFWNHAMFLVREYLTILSKYHYMFWVGKTSLLRE